MMTFRGRRVLLPEGLKPASVHVRDGKITFDVDTFTLDGLTLIPCAKTAIAETAKISFAANILFISPPQKNHPQRSRRVTKEKNFL